MQIGQGESLVHFLCPALPTRPSQAVVVVKRGEDGLFQSFFAELAKSAFEIAVKYSLQGTTQSRYLTGGVPPVRFSM